MTTSVKFSVGINLNTIANSEPKPAMLPVVLPAYEFGGVRYPVRSFEGMAFESDGYTVKLEGIYRNGQAMYLTGVYMADTGCLKDAGEAGSAMAAVFSSAAHREFIDAYSLKVSAEPYYTCEAAEDALANSAGWNSVDATRAAAAADAFVAGFRERYEPEVQALVVWG